MSVDWLTGAIGSSMSKFNVTFSFDNGEARSQFIHWLCGQGEQDYWNWMEYREAEEEEGDITATRFEYHAGNAYDPEPSEVTVKAICGRLTGTEGKSE